MHWFLPTCCGASLPVCDGDPVTPIRCELQHRQVSSRHRLSALFSDQCGRRVVDQCDNTRHLATNKVDTQNSVPPSLPRPPPIAAPPSAMFGRPNLLQRDRPRHVMSPCPRFPMSLAFLISLATVRATDAHHWAANQTSQQRACGLVPSQCGQCRQPGPTAAAAAAPARGTLRHSLGDSAPFTQLARCQLTLCDEPNSHLVPDATAHSGLACLGHCAVAPRGCCPPCIPPCLDQSGWNRPVCILRCLLLHWVSSAISLRARSSYRSHTCKVGSHCVQRRETMTQ